MGPHSGVCAQLDAALRGEWPVGCDTPVPDDFDGWWPRRASREADVIVWVSDARFEPAMGEPSFAGLLGAYAPLRTREITVKRAGRTVRRFTVTVLTRRAGVFASASGALEVIETAVHWTPRPRGLSASRAAVRSIHDDVARVGGRVGPARMVVIETSGMVPLGPNVSPDAKKDHA